MARRKQKPTKDSVPAPVIEREKLAQLIHNPIRLCDLDHKGKAHLYCHRDMDSLAFSDDPESFMSRMIASLLGEGMQVAIEWHKDAADGKAYLVRGFQRVAAHLHIIERGLDPENFCGEMLIDAFEVVNATDQDLIVRSVSDNEVRKSLSDDEVYVAARQMVAAGISTQRAARALGLSPTSFARLHRRIQNPEIQNHAVVGHLGQTDLDAIVEAAAGHGVTDRVGRELAGVVAMVQGHIDRLRAKAQRNGEEFDEAKHGTVRKYITPQQVRSWVTAIKEGRPLAWTDPDREAEDKSWLCKIDTEEGTLKIAAIRKNLHKISPAEIALIAYKLTKAGAVATQWLHRRRAEEALRTVGCEDTGPDFITFLEQHDAIEEANEVRRAIGLESGEDDPAHGKVDPRVETDLKASITVPPPPDEDPGNGEFDPMIDA